MIGKRIRRLGSVHRDQSGSISIASVFALLLLVFLLGMVMNSGQQVDQKIKMQNAADAATYSGGVVLARSMNTLAFTNHLLSDVFALTAFLREARDGNASRMTPEVLANWDRMAPAFAGSEFARFAPLAGAIPQKTPYEQEAIQTYSEWVYASAELILPVMEDILQNRQIPEFQRALVATTPELAQRAADEVAQRHASAWPRPVRLRAVLWRANGEPVWDGFDERRRSVLPVVDPVMDDNPDPAKYRRIARSQRDTLAHRYLREWNSDMLVAFDVYGKMSQFANFWRIFTCGQLRRLLDEEYPQTNLPHVIGLTPDEIADVDDHLHHAFMFVGVVYRTRMADRIPGVFKNPIPTDTQAYAQAMLFIPRARLVKGWRMAGGEPPPAQGEYQGGVPGEKVYLPLPDDGQLDSPPPSGDGDGEPEWYVYRQPSSRYAQAWNLLSQNWTTQLVPATSPRIPAILSTVPPLPDMADVQVPNLRDIAPEDFVWISNH